MARILTPEPGLYLNDWRGFPDMLRDFRLNEDAVLAASELQGIQVLLASYREANYGGDAFVFFRKDGKLFEVNGSHCSWYGLEGQWWPEETSVEALRYRLDKGTLGSNDWNGNVFADELRALLDRIDGGGNPSDLASAVAAA